jgi:hypothetical protein
LHCFFATNTADDVHRGDGKRFVVRANEKLTAFLELRIGDSRSYKAIG